MTLRIRKGYFHLDELGKFLKNINTLGDANFEIKDRTLVV